MYTLQNKLYPAENEFYRTENNSESYRTESSSESYRTESGSESYRTENSSESYRTENNCESYRMENSSIAGQLRMKRYFFLFIGASVFCAVFAFIYHLFSHGVNSTYMTFLFLWPLALGALPAFLAWGAEEAFPKAVPGPTAWYTWCEGVETLTMASLLRGIFEIAGTASVYQQYLMKAGWIILAAGIVLYAAGLISQREKHSHKKLYNDTRCLAR